MRILPAARRTYGPKRNSSCIPASETVGIRKRRHPKAPGEREAFSNESPFGRLAYSPRNATVMGRRAARIAGSSPPIRPSPNAQTRPS